MLVPFIAGCPGLDLEALDKSLDQQLVLGSNAQRAILEHADFPTEQLASLGPLWFLNMEGALDQLQPTVSFAVLDLESGQATVLNLAVDANAVVVADGDRAAWVDRAAGAVVVQTIATGATNTYLAGQVDESLDVLSLVGDLVLLGGYSDVSSSVHVLHLASGADSTLGAGENGSVYAVTDGRYIAVDCDTYPTQGIDENAAPGAWLTSTSIELIDTATGDSATIVPATEESVTLLGIAAGRVVLGRYTDLVTDGDVPQARQVVQVYLIAGGQTETLFESEAAATPDSMLYPVQAGQAGVLLMGMIGDEESFAISYRLQTWGGQTQAILDSAIEFPGRSASRFSFPDFPMAALAGRFVLHEDVDNGGWVIYDPVTQTRRAVQPFAATGP
jgi:predicted DNA-binding protein with PD1-like motif